MKVIDLFTRQVLFDDGGGKPKPPPKYNFRTDTVRMFPFGDDPKAMPVASTSIPVKTFCRRKWQLCFEDSFARIRKCDNGLILAQQPLKLFEGDDLEEETEWAEMVLGLFATVNGGKA